MRKVAACSDWRPALMYSNMLYMKTRVTFRIPGELAAALRELPNQTQFVEEALRAALGRTCPVCDGSGRVGARAVRVSNFRKAKLPPLSREGAIQLRGLVELGRRLAASSLRLARLPAQGGIGFVLERDGVVLLRGRISGAFMTLGSVESKQTKHALPD